MPSINWPTSSRPGLSQAEGAGRLINAFVEQLGDGARAPASRRRAPGLVRFADTTGYGPRGMRLVGSRVLAACHNKLVEIGEDGEATLPAQAFPQRIAIPRADFDFTVGVGRLSDDPTVRDARALISWSDDGGAHWSNPLSRPLGRQGETRTRLSLLRTGMTGAQGRTWRIDVSDPVYCALLGGAMALDPRTE